MDIFNALGLSTQNLLINVNEDLDHALVVSNDWKNRAKMCKKDFYDCIQRKMKKVDEWSEERSQEFEKKIAKKLEEVDQLNQFIFEIDQILEKYSREPLPYTIVKQIASYEFFLYKILMNDSTRKKLLSEIEEEERKRRLMNELVDKIDSMWDNGDSEEDIKKEIYENFKIIYPNLNIRMIQLLSQGFFLFITQGKNVRVNLSKEQLEKLENEHGEVFEINDSVTCGTCLEEFKNGDETIVLPCAGHHRYHSSCIIPWLKMAVNCPTCRTDLRPSLK